mmetsp:Transcript_42723/g.100710  ORF Transcript_42723/g.100710 Transcript_42723/m.100710 type:complete len:349 (+) Transcript_42723:256-1302(+)
MAPRIGAPSNSLARFIRRDYRCFERDVPRASQSPSGRHGRRFRPRGVGRGREGKAIGDGVWGHGSTRFRSARYRRRCRLHRIREALRLARAPRQGLFRQVLAPPAQAPRLHLRRLHRKGVGRCTALGKARDAHWAPRQDACPRLAFRDAIPPSVGELGRVHSCVGHPRGGTVHPRGDGPPRGCIRPCITPRATLLLRLFLSRPVSALLGRNGCLSLRVLRRPDVSKLGKRSADCPPRGRHAARRASDAVREGFSSGCRSPRLLHYLARKGTRAGAAVPAPRRGVRVHRPSQRVRRTSAAGGTSLDGGRKKSRAHPAPLSRGIRAGVRGPTSGEGAIIGLLRNRPAHKR